MDINVNIEGLDLEQAEIEALRPEASAALDKLWSGEMDMTGWVKAPIEQDEEELKYLLDVADIVRSEAELMVVLGIGGSYMGAKAAIEALPKQEHGIEVKFLGINFCTDYYREILSKANNDPGSLWKEEPLDYVNPEDRCQYALVRTAEDEPVPALLLKSRETGSGRYISVFQYDSKSETVSRANPDYPIIDPETSLRLKPGGPGFLEMKEREGWRYANEIHIVNGSIKWSRFFRSAAEMEICYVNDADWQWVSNEVLEVMTRGGEIAWLEVP